MKTVLLKNALIVVSLCWVTSCFSQKTQTRKVYEYVVQKDSLQNRKAIKLKSVKEEKYTESNTTDFDNTAVNFNGRITKDKNCNYQYEQGRKSVSIKKFDKKTKLLLSVTNIYFGNNNKIYHETTIDKTNDSYHSNRYLYNRQGRLVKVITYINGRENGYLLYEYNDEHKENQFSKM